MSTETKAATSSVHENRLPRGHPKLSQNVLENFPGLQTSQTEVSSHGKFFLNTINTFIPKSY